MKALFWIMLAALVLLAGYVIWGAMSRRNPPARTALPFEVSADSAIAYEQRANDLEQRAAELTRRMERLGLKDRPEVKARLAQFEQQVGALRHAIAQWKIARGGDAPGDAYRQCILLYGKAIGICDAIASDTLVGK